MAAPLWLLIDGTNYVHRDFHAAGADRAAGLFGPRVELMAATFRVERTAVAFDRGETWRRAIFPPYKAQRSAKPPEIPELIAAARQACYDREIDVVEAEGFEADDCVATLARIARERGRRVIVASADKDLHQLIVTGLVNQLVAVRRTRTRLEPKWLTADELFAKYGVRPEQWVDYRAIVGDPSDNLTGCNGLGPQAAARVLQACGSLEGFYAEPFRPPLNATQRTRLLQHKSRVGVLRRLLTLRSDVPLPAGWLMEG